MALNVEEYPADMLWDAHRYRDGWDGTKDEGDEPGCAHWHYLGTSELVSRQFG